MPKDIQTNFQAIYQPAEFGLGSVGITESQEEGTRLDAEDHSHETIFQLAIEVLSQQDIEQNSSNLDEYDVYLTQEIQTLKQEMQDLDIKSVLRRQKFEKTLQLADDALAQAEEANQVSMQVQQKQKEIEKNIASEQEHLQTCQEEINLLKQDQAQNSQNLIALGKAFKGVSRKLDNRVELLKHIFAMIFQIRNNHEEIGIQFISLNKQAQAINKVQDKLAIRVNDAVKRHSLKNRTAGTLLIGFVTSLNGKGLNTHWKEFTKKAKPVTSFLWANLNLLAVGALKSISVIGRKILNASANLMGFCANWAMNKTWTYVKEYTSPILWIALPILTTLALTQSIYLSLIVAGSLCIIFHKNISILSWA